ncbi:MAG: hypothetical protein ED556_05955 [Winogradskyella sp.]|uniref:hypothetical protein n=1 Tax=Winogradskyella sp. TaxID=1883156 RepID=UPI000F3B419D|nr:hypothetical protein [Winogradskyella sp.]RNC86965.1 MAG: hypothetical protein ED556_05955 [Winogradskyella sp.]
MKKDKLHTITSSGFKTPKDYFESFNEKLFDRLEEDKLIEGIDAPGFSIPDNYFDNIEDTIISKLDTDGETPVISLFSKTRLYYITGIAASLLLLFAIFTNTTNSDELSVEMVETYLESRDLDSYELAELLADADMLEEEFTITETEYSEENLEEYLLNEVDLESILE